MHCGAAHFNDFHSRNYTRTYSCLARCDTWTINQQDYRDTIIITTNFMFSFEDEKFRDLQYRTKEFCTKRTIQDSHMCSPSAWKCWRLMLWLHSVTSYYPTPKSEFLRYFLSTVYLQFFLHFSLPFNITCIYCFNYNVFFCFAVFCYRH